MKIVVASEAVRSQLSLEKNVLSRDHNERTAGRSAASEPIKIGRGWIYRSEEYTAYEVFLQVTTDVPTFFKDSFHLHDKLSPNGYR